MQVETLLRNSLVKKSNIIPAQTSPSQTRSALPVKTQGRGVKFAMEGVVILRILSANVDTTTNEEFNCWDRGAEEDKTGIGA